MLSKIISEALRDQKTVDESSWDDVEVNNKVPAGIAGK